jgi:hypothetical protein
MRESRFTYVKYHSRGTGKQCMHCNKNARWTAIRKADLKMAVHYCSEHKTQIIDKNGEEK